jgi:hypothetical protein
MEPDVVSVLEGLFEADFPWEDASLAEISDRLTDLGATPVAELAHGFAGLRLRLGMGDVPVPLRREIEAVIYPRLWKVLEAVRAGLPEGEQRARVQVLNRRLARLLAREADPI